MRQVLVLFTGFVAGIALFPAASSAYTVLPARVLPPGPAACSAIVVSEIHAVVTNGVLELFDFTVSDASYVAVAAQVGEVYVPFYYMHRSELPDHSLRMTVMLPTEPMGANIPIQVVMLSAQKDAAGQAITCSYTVPGTIVREIPAPAHLPTVSKPPVTAPENTGATTTTPEPETGHPGIVTATNSLGDLCKVGGGNNKLWIILLVLYAIFVAMLTVQKFDGSAPYPREWNVVLILVGFIGLLLFWYISAICRAGPWAPALATAIAIAGLVFTMLRRETVGATLYLNEPKK